MFKRDMADRLKYFASKLPVVAILGPRQSGKTTLAKATFPKHTYISFEDIDQRLFATDDPRRFLREYQNEHGLILDEIQHVPDLLSYIQTYVDQEKKNGYFILTGSQNFLVTQTISQTLAGRMAVLTLLPLSLKELLENKLITSYEQAIFYGGYPRIFEQGLLPNEWYPSYILNYIERDVRQIMQLVDLGTFQRFIKLCAGRTGQILNVSALATDAGINIQTAKSWLSVLQASYIIVLLQPHFVNFSKRLIKSPKLYFLDTGIACSLLEIRSEQDLRNHYLRGGLFESMIINELYKQYYNQGTQPGLYFWRDSHGHEMDCIIDRGARLIPIEIKAGETIDSSYFDGLEYWNELAKSDPEQGYLIYGGKENQSRSKGNVISWRAINKIVDKYP
ncbi:ATP-binding protein [soil metagenome]